jgi:hypothetical protein
MRSSLAYHTWMTIFATAFAFLLSACQTAETEHGEQKISFNKIFDQLEKYDSVIITLKDSQGRTLDRVYHRKVKSPDEIENLDAPHWDGGEVTVSIVGYSKNIIVYSVDSQFNGKTNQKGEVRVFKDPETRLSSSISSLQLVPGDSITMPVITIEPSALVEKSLKWNTFHPEVIAIGDTYLKAISTGTSEITVSLASDTSKFLVIKATVKDPVRIPENILLSRDTLYLAFGGPAGSLSIKLSPQNATNSVTWKIDDPTVAHVDSNGTVIGVRAGITTLRVYSSLIASIKDSALVVVSASLDTTAPHPPNVTGITTTNTLPKWNWTSGGGDGSGFFRYKVGDDSNMEAVPETRLMEYTLSSAIMNTTYVLYVQERDFAGNWSASSPLAIKYDISKPTVAITGPQKSGTYLTRNTTIQISGSVIPQGSNKIQKMDYVLDGVAGVIPVVLVGDLWSIKDIPLVNDKAITIKVIATDVLGNTGEATLILHEDATAPAAPKLIAAPPVIVAKSDTLKNLKWDWNAPESATDTFIVMLNGTELPHQKGNSYSVNNPNDGSYQLEIFEMDIIGNISSSSKSLVTLVDRSPPNPPNLKVPTSPSEIATWTWISGGEGSGEFECKLDNSNYTACPIEAGFVLENGSDGTHNLSVREKDAAGNYSLASTKTATIDKKPPTFTRTNFLTGPSLIFNTIHEFSGTAADDSPGKVYYQIDGGIEMLATGFSNWKFTPTSLTEGTRSLAIRFEDAAKHSISTTIKATYLPNVVFVRQNVSGGDNDGSSWANAYNSLNAILEPGKTFKPSSPQFWISEGNYTAGDKVGSILVENSSLYGGFKNDGSEANLDERSLSENSHPITILRPNSTTGIFLSNSYKSPDGKRHTSTRFSISDITFENGEGWGFEIYDATNATLKNIEANNWQSCYAVISVFNSTVDILDSHFQNNQASDGIIYMRTGGKIRILNTMVVKNTLTDGAGLTIFRGVVCAGNRTSFSGNNNEIYVVQEGQLKTDGTFDYGIGSYVNGNSSPSDHVNTCTGDF